MTFCSYCLMAGEQRKEWRGQYNMTFCSNPGVDRGKEKKTWILETPE